MTTQIMCRHGVILCYRCGIGKNVTEKKIADMVKSDRTFEHQKINSPMPSSLTNNVDRPHEPSPPKKRRVLPCIHRGDYVGELGCSCDGVRDTYRCTKLDRPGHPGEKAFCIQVLTSKRYSRIVDATTKQTLHRVKNGEVILCKELLTVEMNCSEHLVGCAMYEPTEGPSRGT